MKNKVAQLRLLCTQANRILLTGPVLPDGDSIGACLALRRVIQSVSSARVDVTGKIPYRYQWMPDIDTVKEDLLLQDHYDVAIVLDGDRNRLPKSVKQTYDRATSTALIDHHASTDPSVYTLALLDTAAASTCQMILHIMDLWEVPLSVDVAEMIYTGLIFDTGGFRHSNTTADVHQIAARLIQTGIEHSQIFNTILIERKQSGLALLAHAISNRILLEDDRIVFCAISQADFLALGCTQGDIDGIIDSLVFTTNVELACLCIERGPVQVKLSLRSRKEINVARLAQEIHPDGGGHVRAAGAMLPEKFSSVVHRLPAILCRALTPSN